MTTIRDRGRLDAVATKTQLGGSLSVALRAGS